MRLEWASDLLLLFKTQLVIWIPCRSVEKAPPSSTYTCLSASFHAAVRLNWCLCRSLKVQEGYDAWGFSRDKSAALPAEQRSGLQGCFWRAPTPYGQWVLEETPNA